MNVVTSSPQPEPSPGLPRRCAAWLPRFLLSCAILAAAVLAGRGLAALTGLPIPASLWGMAVLLLLLMTGAVKLSWVETGAGLLLAQMSLFFVPPAVGLVNSLDVLAREWPALLVGSAATSLVLLVLVGRLEQKRG